MNLSNSNRKWLPILTIINNNRVKNFQFTKQMYNRMWEDFGKGN